MISRPFSLGLCRVANTMQRRRTTRQAAAVRGQSWRTSQADERDSPSLAVTEFPCLVVTLSTSPPCCTSTLSLASLKAGEFKLTHRNARCLPHPSWPPGRHFAHHHHRSLLTPLPSSFFPPILPTTGKALHPKPNHEHQHQPRREGVGGEHVPVAGPAPSVRLQGTLWPS